MVVTEILTTNPFVDVIVLSFCCTHFFVLFWFLGSGQIWVRARKVLAFKN